MMTDGIPTRPLRVFLCHSSGDKPIVRTLYRHLKADGFEPWLDEQDLLAGQDWQREIPKAVRAADVVIVCLSRGSVTKAGYVQKEIKFALDVADEQPEGTIFLIPLKLEECDVPDSLRRWHWVNHFEANGYARLVKSLRHRADSLSLSKAISAALLPQPAIQSQPVADVQVDVDTKEVLIGGERLPALSDLEYRLMLLLYSRRDMICDKQHVVMAVWGQDYVGEVDDARINQLFSRLRHKVERDPANPRYLLTVHGRGFVLISASNVSGGVNFDAESVSVGRDVVGRDNITQITYNIEHATINQSGTVAPGVEPTSPVAPVFIENHRIIGGMEFVRVPAGKFLMGEGEEQHTVDLPNDYWLGRYPVTNKQFAQFVKAAKYKFDQGQWQAKANHPVVNVTWRDALAYCKWLNDTLRSELKDGTLRLPTEAEWEKAARGTDGRIYPWGNEWDQSKCDTRDGGTRGAPVGTYSPWGDSPYGAADMAGNVWEWCHSLYKPYPYQANDGRESEAGDYSRVLRGGSRVNNGFSARCACRADSHPDRRLGLTRGVFGFRCCVVPLGSRFRETPDS